MDNKLVRLVAAGVLIAAAFVIMRSRRASRPPVPGPAADERAAPGTNPDPRVGPDPSAAADPKTGPDPDAGSR